MLIDFLKNQSIKKQNRLNRMIESYKKGLAKETDPLKVKVLQDDLDKAETRLKEVHLKIARLTDKRSAKILAKEEKKKAKVG